MKRLKPDSLFAKARKLGLLFLAGLFLLLGFIGIVIPGMPTTIFVILAAWAAAKSSPAFTHWLLQDSRTGPIVRNWQEGRCVPRKAKYMATITMTFSASMIYYLTERTWMMAIVFSCMAGILVWLWLQRESLG